MNTLRLPTALLVAMVSVSNQPLQSQQVSLQTLLTAYTDVSGLPAFLDGTKVAQTSSYDITGGNDDGFSGRYSFVRKLNNGYLVLADLRGPGVINRIWTPTPSDDSLDFYIDDTTRVAFTVKYRDLFSGKVFPFVAPLCSSQLGGYYCYLPIPFGQRCLIVYRGKQTQFHQIGYRLYRTGTPVKKFNQTLDEGETEALRKVQHLWSRENLTVEDFYGTKPQHNQRFDTTFELQPGDTKSLFRLNSGGRILSLELTPASVFETSSKDIDLKITWDNESYPAVYCPVADFFGYAFGKRSMQSLLIGTSGNRNYCYFPMPFDSEASIEFVYRKPPADISAGNVIVRATIQYTLQPRKAGAEGKFYAYWNSEPFVTMHQPHVLLNITGKGHCVGTVLQAAGLSGMTYFFEGDDSTVIDGQMCMHGTGSEDFFNGGWYALLDRWDAAMSLPLSGSLDYSLPFCRTGGYRLFLGDKLSFEKQLFQSIEHGPQGNTIPASYTSLAYYYCDTPLKTMGSPEYGNTRVTVPDTLMVYPQLMNFNCTGEIGIQHRWAYPTGGESYLFTAKGESGIRIDLKEIPAGNYRLYLDYAKLPNGCSFSVWQRQTQLSSWIESYNTIPLRVEKESIGPVTLSPSGNTLTIRLKPGKERNQFYLNRIILVKD